MLYIVKRFKDNRLVIREDGEDFPAPDGRKWATSGFSWTATIHPGALPFLRNSSRRYSAGANLDRMNWGLACKVRAAVEAASDNGGPVKVRNFKYL